MNQARYKETGELIDAEDLRILNNPKSFDFICAGVNCGVPVYPCSFLPLNKPRPYFKIRGVEHSTECGYSSFLDFLKIGNKGPLSSSDLVKMEFPSKLKVYKKPKEIEDKQKRVEDYNDTDGKGTKRNYVNEFSDEKKSNKVVTSINQIVDFYLNCPYNRDVQLDLLGTKLEYYKLFLNVTASSDVPKNQLRLYYAKLDFRKGGKNLIRTDDNNYMFKLYEQVKTKKTSYKEYEPYHVLIKKDEISKTKFNRIQYEKSQVISEYLAKYRAKKNTLEGAYIFFVAYPPKLEEPTIFEVLHGMVVSRYTKIFDTVLD
jgi:hypothetical protein